MRLFRISNLLYMLATVAMASLLFWVSQNVQQVEDVRHDLQEQLESEQENLKVLEAEWHYLTRPQRLEELVQNGLELEAPKAAAILQDVEAVPEPVPVIKPLMKPAVFIKTHPQAEEKKERVLSVENDRERFEDLIGALAPAAGEQQ